MGLLQTLGTGQGYLKAGFLGFQKSGKEFGFISSYHRVPPPVAIKGMSWALHDFVSKTL